MDGRQTFVCSVWAALHELEAGGRARRGAATRYTGPLGERVKGLSEVKGLANSQRVYEESTGL